ncbi:hypothetical protein J5N97_027820 [Dioscorea zingiberensis]|uniref:Neprosin PEP catalytic domain-containing protein n=1 Tax=Dioscorea zingiberensis TaxID=325984 RepID=A0A9D5BXW4_9LILI|nr:hypothetical protein J5N97_027820 [Dioscorea zingiberensis]
MRIGLKDGNTCPSGTVPIKRVSKEDLIRMRSSLKNRKMMMHPPSKLSDENQEASYNQWAIYFTPDNDQINLITSGWTVDEIIYGDNQTRLMTTWTNDNYKTTGCQDIKCPGFVQISEEIPLGAPLQPLSTYGGDQYTLNVLVFKDIKSKNWWLVLGKDKKPIGYWPNEIFTHLSSSANRIDYGGVVQYSDMSQKPPMGSGHFSNEGFGKSCFFGNLQYVNSVCLLLPSFGLGNRINLSIEEDLELERQVKLLNKPAIKTIVKEDGDVFDCVDINKQPAFDHPALKDHKIQLKPSFYQDGQFDNNNGVYSSLRNATSVKIGLSDVEACPLGTVPIRRVTKKDLIGMRSSMKHKSIRPSSAKNQDLQKHAWAALQSTAADGQYYGASSFIMLYGLPQLENNQFSNSLLWVANEPSPAESNQITVGWTVDNTVYGDKNTRLMTAWTVDDYEHTGCIDVRCPGFVQVSSQIALGSTFSALSVFNGPQYGFVPTVSKVNSILTD